MAYLSGNAIYIEGTRRGGQETQSCHTGLYSEGDIFQDNFGFKISEGGGISVNCDNTNREEGHADYGSSSNIRVETTYPDEAIPDTLAINDLYSTEWKYVPFYRSSVVIQGTFVGNSAG